jgi:hypothetical protein
MGSAAFVVIVKHSLTVVEKSISFPPSSFPRKRESRLFLAYLLDPRFHGDDVLATCRKSPELSALLRSSSELTRPKIRNRSDSAPALPMSAPALHAVIMRRFAVIQGQLFPGLDVLLCIDLHPMPKDAHKDIGPAAVVQMTERIPLGAVQRMSVIQVNEANTALTPGPLARRANGYDLAGDLSDLCAARDPCSREHARSLNGTPSGFDGVVEHVA